MSPSPVPPFVHLHTRSWFSFLAGGSSPRDLAARAAELGQPALALTDRHGVYGAVRFLRACRDAGLRALVGAEVDVDGAPLVLLARDGDGYRDLCQLLTEAHLQAARGDGSGRTPEEGGPSGPEGSPAGDVHAPGGPGRTPSDPGCPTLSLDQVAKRTRHLLCLTGGRQGRLWKNLAGRRRGAARRWLGPLRDLFGDALYVELTHGLLPDDGRVARRLHDLARDLEIATVATNDVRHASPDHWARYDLLTCIGLNRRVTEPHPRRPRNAEAYLKSGAQMQRLLPFAADAVARTVEVPERCRLDLLPERLTPPAARLPAGTTPQALLATLCRQGLDRLYPGASHAEAERQLHRELQVIDDLDLSGFFLVVREVVDHARSLGIRCAGRGSAANSIVAYLLGITAVDPIRHHLLFERFLHGGRSGTPDIDVDFDADRRDEIIAWMEARFGIEHTAMTATLVTYRLRLALRDVARALGWTRATVDALSQSVPSAAACQVREHRRPIQKVLGASPLTELLLERVADLHGCPRHLGLHVGGMILSRKPLSHFTPVQVSANGVQMAQFDKEDVEALGLVKLDVLGLRMLACLSEGADLVRRHEGVHIDFQRLPLDDEGVFELIRSGHTVALFQIESQGQMHLISKTRPHTFDDLVVQVALFRPGPLQGGMVHPFLRRRRGLEPIAYEHPSLEPILGDTCGIILFQEQVLDLAHRFAGMSLAQADAFRCLMAKAHDPALMQRMGRRFVAGAVARGVPRTVAESVFAKVSHFVGYGFCRSHAAAFAQTVYHSAWMKRYHPAAHLSAFMQHRPGFYNLMTLEQEARRLGVPVLLPDVNASGTRYDLTRLSGDDSVWTAFDRSRAATTAPGPRSAPGGLAIRKPLTAVKRLSEEVAQRIVWARLSRPFRSVEDLARRVFLDRDLLDALARSGALDTLAGDRRAALWEVGVLARRLAADLGRTTSQPPLLDLPLVAPEDLPRLPPLTTAEGLSWDYTTTGAGRVHPMTVARRHLVDLGVVTVAACRRLVPLEGASTPSGGPTVRGADGSRPREDTGDVAGPVVTVAGIVIVRQRPPTAKGVMFVTVEDETGFLQGVVHARVYERCYDALIRPALLLRGQLCASGPTWRALLVHEVWSLDGVFGGYRGFPSARGGMDRLEDGASAVGAGQSLDAPTPAPRTAARRAG